MSEKIALEQKAKLDTEHQLMALILQKNTLANDILSFFEISVDRAQLVANLLSKKQEVKSNDGLTSNAKEAIQLAVQFASKYGHNNVDCEHLLLSLIANKNFNSYAIVERMGVKPKDIQEQIETIFSEIKKSNIQKDSPNNQLSEDENQFDQPINPFMGMPGGPTATKANKQQSLKLFTTNLNEQALSHKVDPIIGREKEIDRVIQILSRRKKNNPILIGEPGVGKTAIVEGLAQKIVEGQIPSVLANKEILMLDMGSLLAGTMYRGQFESRIKNLLEEISKKDNVILFVDEIHTVVGTGSAEGSMDAANLLKPKLARGDLRMIGATTFDEYKKYIEKDAAFERRFQPVVVNEPSEEETLQILKGIKSKYENHHKVKYTNDALVSAVKFSKRYIQDRYMPDKAIDLIDEAAAATNVITVNGKKLASLRLEMRKISDQKDDAVYNEHYKKASELRQKEIDLNQKITKLEENENSNKQSIIDEQDIAAVVSRWCGIPISSLTMAEKKNFINLEHKLKKFIVGQNEAIGLISKAIRRSRVGISDPKRPIGSFIFLGPTGVGKTELVKVLAREVYGSDDTLVKIDMSEFMERHNISRLVGAPAGYIGYEEGGKLTEKIRRQPYSVILLDEIEKAHPEVFNILLQIMEDGELTDAKGRRVDFRNTIIIMTSNLGSDLLTRQAAIGFSVNRDENIIDSGYQKSKEKVLDSLHKHFRPEFLNRLDQIVVFNPLTKSSIRKIVEIECNKLTDRIKEQNIDLSFSSKAKDFIAHEGYISEYGARPMRRVIIDKVENPLSQALLEDKFKSGDKIMVDRLKDKIVLKHKDSKTI